MRLHVDANVEHLFLIVELEKVDFLCQFVELIQKLHGIFGNYAESELKDKAAIVEILKEEIALIDHPIEHQISDYDGKLDFWFKLEAFNEKYYHKIFTAQRVLLKKIIWLINF